MVLMKKYQFKSSSILEDAGGGCTMMNVLFTQYWLLAMLALIMFEMGAPGLFYSLSLACGAAGAAVGAYYNYSLTMQLGLFLVVSVTALLLLKQWVKRLNKHTKHDATNVYRLKGKVGTVVKVGNVKQFPQVKIDGQIWSAQEHDGCELAVGMLVRVQDVTGVKVIVTIIENS